MTPETVKRLTANCTTDDERAAALSAAIDADAKAKAMQVRRVAEQKKFAIMRAEHSKRDQRMLAEIQALCPHLDTCVYIGQYIAPRRECNVCGKELPV